MLVTLPPKVSHFVPEIAKNMHIFPNLETALETYVGQYFQLLKFASVGYVGGQHGLQTWPIIWGFNGVLKLVM